MAKERFVSASEAKIERFDWGQLNWHCNPEVTAAKDLTVVEAMWHPGEGHSFHKHPRQEEVIFCLEGELTQFLGTEKRVLKPGDSAFIPAGLIHASFNRSKQKAKVLAILGPSSNAGNGVETVDVATEEPWKSLAK